MKSHSSRAPQKHNGFTLAETIVIALILMSLLTISAPSIVRSATRGKLATIQDGLARIDSAKREWAHQTHRRPSDKVAREDLVPRFIEWPESPVDGMSFEAGDHVGEPPTFGGHDISWWEEQCDPRSDADASCPL